MKKKCISKNWNFTNPCNGENKKVDLPHDYVITSPRTADARNGKSIGFFTGERGIYKKYMKFEEAEHTILDIDGAYMCARISFNEDILDMHPNGYAPYLVDLSGKIIDGINNRITIDVLHLQPSTRWYSGSGVYRDVYVWTGGKVRVEPWDVFVSTKEITENNAVVSVKLCISSDISCEAELDIEVFDKDDNKAREKNVKSVVQDGKNDLEVILDINNPLLWDCDSPNLYNLKITIKAGGKTEDTVEERFGIRTVSADSKNGLLLNGKSIKLKGGCIHHDHGVLGSAEFPAAVYRKLKRLKDVGYNAVRTAHNPPSLAFLEICDEIGMIVMDEAFDMWNFPKGECDYSLWFRDWWQRDISYMVQRDRNHPCVISYSIGNEIEERGGRGDGYEWSRKLAEEIRKYDDTKLVTAGICGICERCDENAPDDYKEAYRKKSGDSGDGSSGSLWGEKTEKYMEPLDIVGYNYLFERYANDAKEYPNRVIWGSETHAIKFYDSWQEVMNNSNVIGDFTWTAYDNMGEVGTGRYEWGENGFIPGITFAEYPWRNCYQGDFDLCGYRRPQSYFREAIWKGDTEPRIFTTHPKHNGDHFSGTGWHWYDVAETWTFGEEYIGTPIKTEVYSIADEIIFILNGTEVGRAKPQKGVATIMIPYEKGELTAVAVKDGKERKSYTLKTVGEACKIEVMAEVDKIEADNRDLCYYDIFIEDENGNVVTESECEIECEVFGGELMGVFSGNPANEDRYGSNKCHVFGGKAVAIVRCSFPAKIQIYVKSKGLKGGIGNVVGAK